MFEQWAEKHGLAIGDEGFGLAYLAWQAGCKENLERSGQKPCASISKCSLVGAEVCTCSPTGPCKELVNVYREPQLDGWKEAVLDELAISCLDFPVGTPPREILKAIIDMRCTWAINLRLNKE